MRWKRRSLLARIPFAASALRTVRRGRN